MLESIGFVAAIFSGLVLGLIGGGGSLLTVPILVYLFKFSPALATGYSLLVVGVTSLFSATRYFKQGLLDYRVAVIFSVPSAGGVLMARKWILPQIPDVIFESGGWVLSKDQFILLFFAVLVLIIAGFMLKSRDPGESPEPNVPIGPKQIGLIAVDGLAVGAITGLVGAGGGFMIVPALVAFTPLNLRQAIATSLAIIAIKSVFGFLGDLSEGVVFDWLFSAKFIVAMLGGAVLGAQLNQKLPVPILRKGFGYFVLVMGLFILVRELGMGMP